MGVMEAVLSSEHSTAGSLPLSLETSPQCVRGARSICGDTRVSFQVPAKTSKGLSS